MMAVLRQVLRWFFRIQDFASRGIAWGGAAALGLIVVIFAYEVSMRYLLAAPTYWANDFVSFLLLVSVFLYLPWLTREGGNIAVTIVPDILPPRMGQALLRLGLLAGAAVCLWAMHISIQETGRLLQRNTMTLTTVRLPKWIFLALITYGLGNSGLYFLRLALAPDAQKAGNPHA
jgi:C4-dicarboxylate transporter, DctQ subunit